MSEKKIEIVERDEAGNIATIYVQSTSANGDLIRVDVVLPEKTKTVGQRLLEVFLPAGYPHSVTSDYTQ